MATSIVKQSVQIGGDIRGLKAAYREAAGAQRAWMNQARGVTGISSAFKAVAAQTTLTGKASMAGAIVATKGVKLFTTGLDGAVRAARFAGGAIKSAFTVGAAAIVAATAAVTRFFLDGFADIDNVSDMAKRIGVGVEALSNLQFAATRADVDVAALDTGLGKMLVNVQRAVDGSGEAAKAFDDIGINARELTSLSPDKAFGKIADGIKSIEDPYKQAAAAQAIFGKGGLQLLPMLREGSMWFDEMADAAARTGKQVTALEAARIDAVDGAFKDAKDSIAGLKQSLTVGLAPYVTDLTKRFNEFITSTGGIKSYIGPAIDWLITGVGYLADGFYGVRAVVAFVRSGILKMAEVAVGAFSGLLKGVNLAIDGMNKLADFAGIDIKIGKIDTSGIDGIKDAIAQTSSDYLDEGLANMDKALGGAGSKAVAEWRAGIDTVQKAADETAVSAGNLGGMFGIASRAMQQLNEEAIDTRADGVKALDDAMAEVRAQIDELNQSPIDIKVNALVSQLPDELKSQADEYRALLEQFEGAKSARVLLDSLTTPLDEAQKKLEEIQAAFADGFIDADQQQQLLDNLRESIEGASVKVNGPSDQFAAAANVGSVESNRLDALFRNQQARSQSKSNDPQVKAIDKTNTLLARIETAIGKDNTTILEMSI